MPFTRPGAVGRVGGFGAGVVGAGCAGVSGRVGVGGRVVGGLVGLGGDAAPGPRAVVQVACRSWWQCHGQLERALAEVIGPQGPIFVCPVAAPFLD